MRYFSVFQSNISCGKASSFSILYRWSYDNYVTEASISQEIPPLEFPLKLHNWSHVVISVQAGQEGDVSGGKVRYNIQYVSDILTFKTLVFPF